LILEIMPASRENGLQPAGESIKNLFAPVIMAAGRKLIIHFILSLVLLGIMTNGSQLFAEGVLPGLCRIICPP
jgi:hypothetical protein